MKVNESPLDRFVRLILGSVLVIYGLFGLGGLEGGTAGVIVAVVGGVLLFTAATGFCALYKLFGITTCKNCGPKTANR
jgi:uncharacterized membrane protein